tara:strand:- start:1029 stop:1295 length:267 start_codon:yes stop_codon:yes gene_type:complete
MKASKEKLETHVEARPGASETPGYYDDAGSFVRGPFWMAKLGSQVVALKGSEGYLEDVGFYISRHHALKAAKAVKEKAKQWLAEGNYE